MTLSLDEKNATVGLRCREKDLIPRSLGVRASIFMRCVYYTTATVIKWTVVVGFNRSKGQA